MCIIIGDVYQFIGHCLIPLDPCFLSVYWSSSTNFCLLFIVLSKLGLLWSLFFFSDVVCAQKYLIKKTSIMNMSTNIIFICIKLLQALMIVLLQDLMRVLLQEGIWREEKNLLWLESFVSNRKKYCAVFNKLNFTKPVFP